MKVGEEGLSPQDCSLFISQERPDAIHAFQFPSLSRCVILVTI